MTVSGAAEGRSSPLGALRPPLNELAGLAAPVGDEEASKGEDGVCGGVVAAGD